MTSEEKDIILEIFRTSDYITRTFYDHLPLVINLDPSIFGPPIAIIAQLSFDDIDDLQEEEIRGRVEFMIEHEMISIREDSWGMYLGDSTDTYSSFLYSISYWRNICIGEASDPDLVVTEFPNVILPDSEQFNLIKELHDMVNL